MLLALALPLARADDNKKPKDDVSKIGERDVDGKINLYSIDKEIAMGKQLADEVERDAKVIKDPIIAEYINRVGQNLARHSDTQMPFTFKVLEDPSVNAFALPGGFCFVNTGLILKAESEAEMAGVLAHEIAHVAARHGTRQATRGEIANLATIPIMIATGGGWGGYAIQQGVGMAIPMAFLKFSRGFEAEADYLGLQYMYAAGYDPTAFVDFFEKLAAQEKTKPGTLAAVFGSHPMTDDRIEKSQEEMNTILPPKPEYVVNTSDFLKTKKRLALLLDGRLLDSDRPQVRRRTEVIRPGDEKSPDQSDKDEGPPVLKRKDSTSSDSGKSGDERPTLKRSDP